MSKVKHNKANAIFVRDFNEYKSGMAFKILAAAFIIVTAVICIKLFLSDKSALKLTLCSALFLLALIPTIVTIPLFTTAPFTRDKTNGTIANLLAAPLNTKEIVNGKSLAVFLPGFIISILSPLVVVLLSTSEGMSVLTIPFLLAVFVITPLFCLGLTKFTIQLLMIKSPELAISPSYLIGFTMMIGVPLCSSMGIFDITSWSFNLVYLGVTLFVWVLVSILSMVITKERVILSK